MISRRTFIGTMAVGVLAGPLPARAQRAGKVWRIGYLDQGSATGNGPYFEAFRQGLRDLGWTEGKNITIEVQFAEGKTERLPALAAELARQRVDLIATASTPAALAAKQATSTIPIVMGFVADPVGSGVVRSLARPGGNITGWTHQGLELRGKYLELLKEAVPDAMRFGVLWNPANPVHQLSMGTIEAAARRLKVELYPVGVHEPREIEGAFSALAGKRVDALVVFPDGMFIAQRSVIVGLAARRRLPAMYGVREYAEAGGLMSYGTNLLDMFRLSASFADKILKGARPADLPVEQPTKFELIVNLKTANALGLTIPSALLQRADEIIQ